MKDYFANKQSRLEDGTVRISPSQISRFFDETWKWYRSEVLKEEGYTFEGNKASYIGDLVHAYAESIVLHKGLDDIDNVVEQFRNYMQELGIDPDEIENMISTSEPMKDLVYDKLVNRGLHTLEFIPEMHIRQKLNDYATLAGTIDLYDKTRGIIVDFKTYKPAKKIPDTPNRGYYFQMLAYTWLLQKQGMSVNQVEWWYITKPELNRVGKRGRRLDDYPSILGVSTLVPTKEDLELIDNTIKLIGESVEAFKTKPEIRHLLAQDYRLKINPNKLRFKRRR